VPAAPDPLLPGEPDARTFDRILGWIGAQFRVLDPVEACERLYAGTLPSRPAVISFDDGYRDNFDVALPLLQRRKMRAIFFVATGFLHGGTMFNDRIIEAIRSCVNGGLAVPLLSHSDPGGLPLGSNAQRQVAIQRILEAVKRLPPAERLQRVVEIERAAGSVSVPRLMMNPEQVAGLYRAGMRIGGHTRTHPILCALDDIDAEREIAGGLEDLTSIVGERPTLFAFPNGKRGEDFDSRHVAMVQRLGCAYSFTTEPGAASSAVGRYELPRFTPWDRTRARFQLRSWRNLL
jgi:peptidoglycan/xylan/chitin deacetylase (PgdA/CDA1 family)